MKLKKRQLHLVSLMSLLLLINIPLSLAADPMLTNITLDPTDPEPTDTITFTAIIESEETPTSVYIIVQECKADICFKDGYNESMALVDTDQYQGQVTLGRADATYIKYHVEILSNGVWYASDIIEFNLTIEQNGNGENGDNGTPNGENGDNGDSTPGFELLAFLIAGVIIISLRRKRSR
jgi:hypothetical protein